jgi:hypothetical protein
MPTSLGESTARHELGRRGTGGTDGPEIIWATLEMTKIVETEKRIRANSSRTVKNDKLRE